jgi:hypothetical protein
MVIAYKLLTMLMLVGNVPYRTSLVQVQVQLEFNLIPLLSLSCLPVATGVNGSALNKMFRGEERGRARIERESAMIGVRFCAVFACV